MKYNHFPQKQGLYDPQFEKDSCGVGFLCDVKGRRSNSIVKKSIKVLERLAHRGAVGSDPKTGDGAGILIQIPHIFFSKTADEAEINLPAEGEYGTGLIFLPTDTKERLFCKGVFEKVIKSEEQIVLGWRDVPVDNSVIGKAARESEPAIEQVFIAKNRNIKTEIEFERRLYLIRKRIESFIRASKLKQKSFFYITNLSCRTFLYKGLLMPGQVKNFFLDLKDKSVKSAIALVHSRYSTNTFPTWDLSQPFRALAHNGEINTLRGNINWMNGREGLLKSPLFKDNIEKIKPVIIPGGSDSAAIDNVFELLMLSGRSLAHSMMMLIPNAWEQNRLLDKKLKDFYKYHACIMEPWDGPAAIAFTDGKKIGAVLDRNGLRPARYIVTRQDLVVMSSEVGVLDIKPDDIRLSGRLEPGKMLFIDTEKEKIIDDWRIKEVVSTQRPYGLWLKKHLVEMNELPSASSKKEVPSDILTSMKVFGYTREDLKKVIKPMAESGSEPIGAMGNDTPHAILSKNHQLTYNYFKQLFAQVTNPAIDPIRENLVMSLETFIGPARNLLAETPSHCHRLRVKEPILTNDNLEKIRRVNTEKFKTKTVSLLFNADRENNFLKAVDRICKEVVLAVEKGYTFIILSDRGVNSRQAALPALLAAGAVHHHLIRKALRTRIGIIVESAEPKEVHHFGLLFGYGADCVNPYLAYESLKYLVDEGELDISYKIALKNYRKAVNKGILKILSKIGISTLQSYRGAQIFEALGLNDEVINKCFCGTTSRIGGADFKVIARETISRHSEAYGEKKSRLSHLKTGGLYQWKRDGEFHLWNPRSIACLQEAARKGDYDKYKEFACIINNQSQNPTTLRSLLKFKKTKPISINKVEPARDILKRFATGAMSFGSISRETHEILAITMNRIGGRSNTGEGGEDPARFKRLANGDLKRSAIKQIASGRFGVSTNYLVNADELQIKIAQGAKPGEGGQLPGHKVSAIIAKTRYTTPGVTLISPPPHHDIYSIEDLAQLIFDLKNVNPYARISVKLVSEVGVGTVAAGVAKGHADMILISGADGGTGASPMSSIRHAGLPWELGLSETHQTLVLNGLRNRLRLQTDGQMRTGRDVAIAALLGAEEYGFCSAALIVLGCVMLRHCNLNNCSLGIATQNEILRKRFSGRPEYVENYFRFVVRELRDIMAQLGIKKLDEMIGRSDLLQVNSSVIPEKAKDIDFSRILYRPKISKKAETRFTKKQDHGIGRVLDKKLIKLSKPALEKGQKVEFEIGIKNVNRTTGAMLSGEICRRYGEEGLPGDTVCVRFKGTAGQSFGAWLAKGITFELEGPANDYVGKGISGGKIIIYPDRKACYKAEDNVLVGNTTFYGAVSGEAYISGLAGERFCIRNSGLLAVVEGVGDHGCEYMTGGRVVIIGNTGRNFGAGMSGGIAYVFDEHGGFKDKCNMNMIKLEKISSEDKAAIHNLLHNHLKYTGSQKAKRLLDSFSKSIKKFVKVMPIEYKRILDSMKLEKKLDLLETLEG